jgi:mono/diheme cytochrome c family protein
MQRRLVGVVWMLLCLLTMVGCGVNMREGGRLKPYENSAFFPNNGTSLQPVPSTVAQGQLREDVAFYTGQGEDGQAVTELPFPVNAELLNRGKQRFNIYCAPCHGFAGLGNGMIVQRGFPPPPSFHTQRLREAPVGYYYSVITNGFGRMYSYSSRIVPEDRWAITAYIRALQLSQNATLEDVPADQRGNIGGGASR